jgi:hypothetical protein
MADESREANRVDFMIDIVAGSDPKEVLAESTSYRQNGYPLLEAYQKVF